MIRNLYTLKFIRHNEEYLYTLTNNDIITLLRAVNSEGKPQDAVTWTLLNRFAWIYPSDTYSNLSSFIKEYAESIGPKWFNGPKETIRRKNASLKFEEIPTNIKDTVFNVLNGYTPNPVKGAVHFRMSTAPKDITENEAVVLQKQYIIKSNKGLVDIVPSISHKEGYNWFFTTKNSNNFSVKIFHDEFKDPPLHIGLINSPTIGLMFLGAGLYAIYKHRKLNV